MLRSPSGRVVKKFGHVRSASMVDLLFQEVQQAAAGHQAQLKDTVSKNERAHEQKIDADFALIQRNVRPSQRPFSPRLLRLPLLPSLSSLSLPSPLQNAGFVAEIKDYLALSKEQQTKYAQAHCSALISTASLRCPLSTDVPVSVSRCA